MRWDHGGHEGFAGSDEGQKLENLYKLIGSTVVAGAAVSSNQKSSKDDTKLWHMRLGHLSKGGMMHIHKKHVLKGVKSCDVGFCRFWVYGKQKRISFKAGSHTKGVLNYVHSDV